MGKSIGVRFAAVALVAVISLLYFLPSLPERMISADTRAKLPGEGINLGLDLQGGIHLVLKVARDVAASNFVDRTSDSLAQTIKDAGLNVTVRREGPFGVTITGVADQATRDRITTLVEKDYGVLALENREQGTDLAYRLSDPDLDRIRVGAVTQSVETIRNRIDQFGVAEPLIQQQGSDEILVQLPGVSDPDRAIDLIGKTALLEFKLVDEAVQLERGMPLPEDDEILYRRVLDPQTGQELDREPHVVKKQAMLAGDTLTDARVSINQFNEPYVAITFDPVGAKIFDQVTGEHVGERFAIVLDGNVYSAPVIQERIGGGRASITGQFTSQEANDLAIVLRAGALPAPVEVLQNVTVGPSLGQDSIHAGLMATVVGTALVVLFMTIYYRLAGVIANVALMLNLIVLVGALGAMHATLTLPGIAGIALTVGMGVDSNVLIFERIREELRLGKTVRLAVDQGYDRAWVTIVDAHVTALITSAALFLFGSGPVKGFAVTLSLGILINLFTAFVGTKVFFDWMNSRRRLETLSI
ncbi:MAG: protein translocase subunit SecD [Nitrospirae bacterium]|nr:protein translocase subunit SecD [Nitrospirota bacterium]